MIQRRGFLGSLAALAAAPFVARKAEPAVPEFIDGGYVSGPTLAKLSQSEHVLTINGRELGRMIAKINRKRAFSRAVRATFALAFLWTQAAAADQPCRDDAGRFMPCSEVVADPQPVPIVDPLPTGPAPGYEAKPEGSTDFTIDGGAGVSATLTSEGGKQEPIAHLVAGFDLATNEKSPRLDIDARFGTSQGSAPSLSEPASFRSVSFEGRLSQPLWKNLLLRPALLAGIEIRMATDGMEPRHQGVRYICLGGQVSGDPGYFFAGVCGDERVSASLSADPAYLPSASVSWLLKLRDLAGGNLRAYLVGKVVAYLRLGYGSADAGNATASVGFMVGGGNKR